MFSFLSTAKKGRSPDEDGTPLLQAHINGDSESRHEAATRHAALQSQRAVNKAMLERSLTPSITVEVPPDGNCGFTAAEYALRIYKQEILAIAVTRVGFIQSVKAAIVSLRKKHSVKVVSLLTDIYADAYITEFDTSPEKLARWESWFDSSSSWATDASFAWMSYKHNIRFEFYVLDPKTSSHLILRGSDIGHAASGVIGPDAEDAETIIVRLLHNSAGPINPEAVEANNHFDLLFFEPSREILESIASLRYTITQASSAQTKKVTFEKNAKENATAETSQPLVYDVRKHSAQLILNNILEQKAEFYYNFFNAIVTKLTDKTTPVTIAEHLLLAVAINDFLQNKPGSLFQKALENNCPSTYTDKTAIFKKLREIPVAQNDQELLFLEKLCELFSAAQELCEDHEHLKAICDLAFTRIDSWINNRCWLPGRNLVKLHALLNKNPGLKTLYATYAASHSNRFSTVALEQQDQDLLVPPKKQETLEVELDSFSAGPTSTSEEEALIVDNAPLQSTFSTTIVTYNACNENPPKEAIEDLKREIFFKGNNPAIIVFAEQETKSSWTLEEDVAERVLKRCTDSEGKPLYTILHEDGAEALTHPWYPKNYVNRSQTRLVIAYKNSSFPSSAQIKIRLAGQSVTDKRDHKGGIYAVLSVHDVNIAVIAAHLHSWDEKVAKEQADALISACKAACTQADISLAGVIIAGDFNTRVHPKDLSEETDDAVVGRRKTDSVRRNVSRRKDALSSPIRRLQKSSQELEALTFFEPQETHCKETRGHLKPNSKRDNCFDYGALDNIAFQNYADSRPVLAFPTEDANQPKIARPQYKIMAFSKVILAWELSDHAAVIGVLNITCPALLTLSNHLSENKIETEEQLQALHLWLIADDNNKAKLLRAYFDYAIEKTAPDNPADIKYHLSNTDLIQEDLFFIIENLSALNGTSVKIELYNRLIFETCKAMETQLARGGKLMRDMYNKLLDAEYCSSKVKIDLLKPLRKWLDQHNINRARYTLSGSESNFTVTPLGSRGFFTKAPKPVGVKLTSFGWKNVR